MSFMAPAKLEQHLPKLFLKFIMDHQNLVRLDPFLGQPGQHPTGIIHVRLRLNNINILASASWSERSVNHVVGRLPAATLDGNQLINNAKTYIVAVSGVL